MTDKGIKKMTAIKTTLDIDTGRITCDVCGASAETSSKQYGRFMRRHPSKCQERQEFNRQLAEGVRSVEPNAPQVVNDQWVGDENNRPANWEKDKSPHAATHAQTTGRATFRSVQEDL